MTATTTSRGVTFIRPTTDERHEQKNILNLVDQLGGVYQTIGTGHRQQFCVCGVRTTDQGTRQSPGLPDLWIVLPPAPATRAATPNAPWVALWVEVKGKGGTLSPEQVECKYVNERAGVVHLVGGLDAFLAWLRAGGWVR